jgi:hypothetical protein
MDDFFWKNFENFSMETPIEIIIELKQVEKLVDQPQHNMCFFHLLFKTFSTRFRRAHKRVKSYYKKKLIFLWKFCNFWGLWRFGLPFPYLTFFGMLLSVAHLYSSRTFQRAIVELCRRQGSKVIEGTTDGRQSEI